MLAAASRPDCCNDYASRDDARTRRKRLRPWSPARPRALFLIKMADIFRFWRRPKSTLSPEWHPWSVS